MSSASDVTDAAIAQAFAAIPALLDRTPALIARGRFLDCECLLGPINHPFHATIRAGRVVDLTPAPVLMRSWRFSYRASAAAWAEYWQAPPRPGFHDLLALTKRGEATLEGRPASVHGASAILQGCAGAAAPSFREVPNHERCDRADRRPLRPRRYRRRDASHLFRGKRRGHPAGLPAHRRRRRKAMAASARGRGVYEEFSHHRVRHALAWQVQSAGKLGRFGISAHDRALYRNHPRILHVR